MSVGNCFHLEGDCIVFGDVEPEIQEAITAEVCKKFGQVASEGDWDRANRCTILLEPGIPEEQADEAFDFAQKLSKKHNLIHAYPSEICS